MAIILVFLEFGHVFALLGDYPKFSTVEGPLQNIPEMGRGHGKKLVWVRIDLYITNSMISSSWWDKDVCRFLYRKTSFLQNSFSW